MITGESGSGKELIARAVHHYSLRSHKPWVDLSCAALPEHLIESELFGYEKGAFSGADTSKPGLFEMASGGTIFLDEIGELDPRMQVKLLRVLDSVAYYRLGGTKKVSVDVRVVAATNQDLEKAVAEGRFRGDLVSPAGAVHFAGSAAAGAGGRYRSAGALFPGATGSAVELCGVRDCGARSAAVAGEYSRTAQRSHEDRGAGAVRGNFRRRSRRSRSRRMIPWRNRSKANDLESLEKRAILEALDGERRASAAGGGATGDFAADVEPQTESVSSGSDRSAGVGMSLSVSIAEKRREKRHPGSGNVLVRPEAPGSRDIQGKLVDVSDSGFRMAHRVRGAHGGAIRAVRARRSARAGAGGLDAYRGRRCGERVCGGAAD